LAKTKAKLNLTEAFNKHHQTAYRKPLLTPFCNSDLVTNRVWTNHPPTKIAMTQTGL